MFHIRSNRQPGCDPTRAGEQRGKNLSPFCPQRCPFRHPVSNLFWPNPTLFTPFARPEPKSRSRGPPKCWTTTYSAQSRIPRKRVNHLFIFPLGAFQSAGPLGITATRGKSATDAGRKSQSESVKKFLSGERGSGPLTNDRIDGRNELARAGFETSLKPLFKGTRPPC